jgi:hypothetical protein
MFGVLWVGKFFSSSEFQGFVGTSSGTQRELYRKDVEASQRDNKAKRGGARSRLRKPRMEEEQGQQRQRESEFFGDCGRQRLQLRIHVLALFLVPFLWWYFLMCFS